MLALSSTCRTTNAVSNFKKRIIAACLRTSIGNAICPVSSSGFQKCWSAPDCPKAQFMCSFPMISSQGQYLLAQGPLAGLNPILRIGLADE